MMIESAISWVQLSAVVNLKDIVVLCIVFNVLVVNKQTNYERVA